MMLPRVLLAPALLLLLAPLAGAHSFSGTVTQGETDVLPVDHGGGEIFTLCAQVITHWTVSLTYAPASDVLTLAVPEFGEVALGTNGHASVSFTTNVPCVSFTVLVQGTLVADEAAYGVRVSNQFH